MTIIREQSISKGRLQRKKGMCKAELTARFIYVKCLVENKLSKLKRTDITFRSGTYYVEFD